MDPTNLNSVSSQLNEANGDGDLASLEFRRIICEGVYDESKSIFVGPRSRSISGLMENGYYVLTPLLLSKEPRRYIFSSFFMMPRKGLLFVGVIFH